VAYAEVCVNSPIPSRETYTYEIPVGLAVRPGHGVYVPFGPRILQGVVFALADESSVDARPISGLIDQRPLVDEARLALARWISQYYLSSLYAALSLMLPPAFERKPLTIVEPGPHWSASYGGSMVEQSIVEAVATRGRVEIDDLKRSLGLKSSAPIKTLERAGVLVRAYQLDRPRVSAKLTTYVELTGSTHDAMALATSPEPRRSRQADLLERLAQGQAVELGEARTIAGSMGPINRLISEGLARLERGALQLVADPVQSRRRARELRLTARQRQAAAALQRLIQTESPVPYPDLRRETGVTRLALEELAQRGIVELRDVQSERDPLGGRVFAEVPCPVLTVDQAVAAEEIGAAITAGPERFLIHGVTGAGKTEVYLDALQRAISAGKRGIALVPEISLTPQTIRRFVERFPGRVAVVHSGLSPGKLFDQWHGIRDGRYDVVVGARSALFAPQPNLGLIVIDEEHEWTYKQAETPPRYDARRAAAELASLTNAVLVAGSATPSVESYHSAIAGKSRLLELKQRVVATGPGLPSRPIPLPPVSVVDLRDELRSGNRSVFSRLLQEKVRETLTSGRQVILFLNRRGSASFLLCRACGHVPRCSSCGLAYSFHAVGETLVCHGCNRRRKPLAACPNCQGPYLKPMGAGTQRIEEEARSVFAKARVLRWDRDATRAKGGHERILARFLSGEADILVGTQMLAKGLDIPAVGLVGVISADIGLNLPDFRAAERSFQLLAQVAGRAGRAGEGEVVIQTYQPDHYAVVAAASHDYLSFYEREIDLREKLRYPPFRRLARLTYAHTNEQAALREASKVADGLRREVSRRGVPGTEVIGPAPGFTPRLRGRYRWQVVVKGREPAEVLEGLNLRQGWSIDVDPVTAG
jgi:primosomal protein N' (replication factor Y) (superfamily II helicase)